MSQWTHPICDSCWRRREGDRTPYRLVLEYREPEGCCFCGRTTMSGIYVREDPAALEHHTEHGSSDG